MEDVPTFEGPGRTLAFDTARVDGVPGTKEAGKHVGTVLGFEGRKQGGGVGGGERGEGHGALRWLVVPEK